jgi:hypothetical protein
MTLSLFVIILVAVFGGGYVIVKTNVLSEAARPIGAYYAKIPPEVRAILPYTKYLILGLLIYWLLVSGIVATVLAWIFVILILPFAIGFILTIIPGEWDELGNEMMKGTWTIYKSLFLWGKRRAGMGSENWNYIYTKFQEKLGYWPVNMKTHIDIYRQLPQCNTPENFVNYFIKEQDTFWKERAQIGLQALFKEDNRFFPVYLWDERRIRHTWITGMSGTGKSTTISHLVHHDIANEDGFLLITPRRDFIESHVMPVAWEQGKKGRKPLYFDPTMPTPLPWNPLLPCVEHEWDAQKGEYITHQLEGTDTRANAVVAMFREVMPGPGAMGWTPRMEEVLENCLKAIIEQRGTFLDVFPLLDLKSKEGQEARKRAIASTQDDLVKDFFANRFPIRYNEYKESIVALYVRLTRLLSHRGIRYMLCAYQGQDAPDVAEPHKSIPMTTLLGTRHQFMVNCSPELGIDNARMLGRLFVSAAQSSLALLEQKHETDRRPYYFYIDEAQEFFPGAPQLLGYMLDASRQYQYGWTFATPPLRSENRLLEEILYSNCSNVVAFQLQTPNSEKMARSMFARKAVPLTDIRDYMQWAKHLKDYETGQPTPDALRARERLFQLAEAAGIDTHQPEQLMLKELEAKGAVFENVELDPRDFASLPELGAYARIGSASEGGQWVVRMDGVPYVPIPETDWKQEYQAFVKENFSMPEEPPPPPEVKVNGRSGETYAGEPIEDVELIYPRHV